MTARGAEKAESETRDALEAALDYVLEMKAARNEDVSRSVLVRQLRGALNTHAALLAENARLRDALENAEFLLRKVSINWKEAGSMRDSLANAAALARAALAEGAQS